MRLHSDKELQYIMDDHKEILDSIKRGDKEGAVNWMKKHLTRYKVDEELIRREHPDFFI